MWSLFYNTTADELYLQENVLVIEYGEIMYAPGGFDPPQTIWGSRASVPGNTWTFNSLPNPEVKNRTGITLAGKMVGGSSAVNGMFFDRPAKHDFDAWTEAGSPELDGGKHKWGWDGIFPYFKKVGVALQLSKSRIHNS